jgi:hypothetical protein
MSDITQKPNSPTQADSDRTRWTQLNPWLSEGQSNDREQMNSSVADSGGPPSAQRALARRSHQANFKKWSQSRHD